MKSLKAAVMNFTENATVHFIMLSAITGTKSKAAYIIIIANLNDFSYHYFTKMNYLIVDFLD